MLIFDPMELSFESSGEDGGKKWRKEIRRRRKGEEGGKEQKVERTGGR